MKSVLKGCGVLALIIFLSAGGFGIYFYFAYNDVSKQTSPIAREAIIAIVQNWDKTEVEKRASPELMKIVTPEQMDKLFRMFSKLGKYKQLDDLTLLKFHTGAYPESGGTTMVYYSANGSFENGKGIIKLTLIKKGSEWKINDFAITSEAFL